MSDILKAVRGENTSEILESVRVGTQYDTIIEWPGRPDIKIGMRLLSVSETRQAKIENQKEFKAAGLDIAVHNLADYRAQEAAHAMWRAFYDPGTRKELFHSVHQLRSFCTDDELTALANAYNTFAESNDPNLENMSEDDVDSLISLLKKTPEKIPQTVSNLHTAWRLLRTLVVPQKT
jgi:hypothetical protein